MKTSSISGVTLLTIIFLVLKLTNVIGWSWWWVLSPIWIAAAVVLIVVIVASFAAVIKNKRKNEINQQ